MRLHTLASAYCPAFLRPMLDRVAGSPIGSRLASGVFWALAGTVISRGLMLLASILICRMFGRVLFGELVAIRDTIHMLGLFAGFGLGVTTTRYVAQLRQTDPERAGRIIGLSACVAFVTGSLIGLGLLVYAPWLAEHSLERPHLVGPLRIGALMLLISAINGAQIGTLAGFEAFRKLAVVNLLIALTSLPILLAGAHFGGVVGAVWAYTIHSGVSWVFNHLALRSEARRFGIPFTLRHCGREWRVLWKFSVPAILAGSLFGPVNWFCMTILLKQPNGYADWGMFAAANQWYATLLFLPGLLGSVVLPVLSERFGQNDMRQSAKTLTYAIKTNMLLVFPLVLGASLLSPIIMGFNGPGFREGWPTLVVVLITAGLVAVQTPVGQIIAASGRMWLGLAMNAGWASVFIVATVLLVRYGAIGLASARAVAYVAHATWTLGFAVWVVRSGEKK